MPHAQLCQFGGRIISFIRSARAKENIPVPCGRGSLKGRDCVLNYSPRGVDPRSDAFRPGKRCDRNLSKMDFIIGYGWKINFPHREPWRGENPRLPSPSVSRLRGTHEKGCIHIWGSTLKKQASLSGSQSFNSMEKQA